MLTCMYVSSGARCRSLVHWWTVHQSQRLQLNGQSLKFDLAHMPWGQQICWSGVDVTCRAGVLTTMEKPGNLMQFVNSGKFMENPREFKINSRKMMLSQMATVLRYRMCCLSTCDITVCQHFWMQPCCYMTLGLSRGHRVDSIIVSNSYVFGLVTQWLVCMEPERERERTLLSHVNN